MKLKKERIDKQAWLDELRKHAIESFGFTWESALMITMDGGWKGYYEDGYSPFNAIAEDMSYAD